MIIILNFLTKRWESKAAIELQLKESQHRQIENKKILDTMITLASMGELTPERYGFFISLLSNER